MVRIMLDIKTDATPDALTALRTINAVFRSKLMRAFSTLLQCALVRETFGQVFDERPMLKNRNIDTHRGLDDEVFSKQVSKQSLDAYDKWVRDINLANLELDVSIPRDLEACKSTSIPSTVFLRAICTLLRSFTFDLLRDRYSSVDKARFFCNSAFRFPDDPLNQVFCWVQTIIFGGVLYFLVNPTGDSHDVYIRNLVGRPALVYRTQVDEFALMFQEQDNLQEELPQLRPFDIDGHHKITRYTPGAERIYGPLPKQIISRMRKRARLAAYKEKSQSTRCAQKELQKMSLCKRTRSEGAAAHNKPEIQQPVALTD